MNIFVLDNDPEIAAEMHCDKHIPKMVLELAQMLTTAHHVCNSKPWEGMYIQAHLNHPCTKWVRNNYLNYRWAYAHFKELSRQYHIRFGRMHKSFKEHYEYLQVAPADIPNKTTSNFLNWRNKNPEPFAQAMPDEYKNEDAVTAYRTYYINDKQRFAKWERGVDAPDWWVQNVG